MALDEIIRRIDTTADYILGVLSGGNGLVARVDNIEQSIFSGSGQGLKLSSAAIVGSIYSNNYSQDTAGWIIKKNGFAEFEDVKVRGEIHASSFVYDSISAVGGIQIVAPASVLAADVSSGDTTITVKDAQFSTNDFITLKYGGNAETMKVTGGGGTVTLTVTRAVTGSDHNWAAGTAVVRLMDRIVLDTVSSNSPYVDIIDYTGPLYSDASIKVRLGNLAGISDATLNPSGFGLYTNNAFLTGKAVFGGGNVILDSNGLQLETVTSYPPSGTNVIQWQEGTGDVYAQIWGWSDGASSWDVAHLYLEAESEGIDPSDHAEIVARATKASGDEAWARIQQYNSVGGIIGFGFSTYPTYTYDLLITEDSPPATTIYNQLILDNSLDPFGSTVATGHPVSSDAPSTDQISIYSWGQSAMMQHSAQAPVHLSPPYSGGNLVKNYPSMEQADGAKPGWWGTSNCTLTEEDATGASVTGVHERVLKGVTTSAAGFIYNRQTIADEPTLFANVTYLTASCWVYVVTAGTCTLQIRDGASGLIASGSTTTTGGWVKLVTKPAKITSGSTWVDFRVTHSATSATFYVAMPMMNTGFGAAPWRPRGLIYKDVVGALPTFVSFVSPSAANSWTTIDATSSTSNITAKLNLFASYYEDNNVQANNLGIRRYGNSGSNALDHVVLYSYYSSEVSSVAGTIVMLCDEYQRVEYAVSSTSCDSVYIRLIGYWEWE